MSDTKLTAAQVVAAAIEDHVPGEEFVTPHARAVDLATYIILRLHGADYRLWTTYDEDSPEEQVWNE